MPGKLEYMVRTLFWEMNRPFIWLFMKQNMNFSTAAGSDRVPKPPFILVANHANFFDPWMVGYQCHNALFIMMNDDGFRGNPFKAWYLRTIGAFPKKKGAHDFKAMKYTLQLLKNGFPVLIFPEGQTSWDGETQPVYSGIEKIISRAKVPLVMMNLRGNFLSKPWWADRARKGKIVINIKVMDQNALIKLSDDQILQTIKTFIYNNDIKNPANRKNSFIGQNLTSGLERFVWICPHCKAEDALLTESNNITCTACSASWEMDTFFSFRPRMPGFSHIGDLHDWVSWHKRFVRDRLNRAAPGDTITQSTGVIFQACGQDNNFIEKGYGALTLTPEELRFDPDSCDTPAIRWPIGAIEDYVVQLRDIFEFRSGKDYFRFVFNRRSPMKWQFYIRYMKGYDEIEKRGHY